MSLVQTARRGRPRRQVPALGPAEAHQGAPTATALDPQAAILDAALTLFAERSVTAVSMKQIAAAAGVNASLIHYYFGSKDALFQRAVAIAVHHAFDRFTVERGESTSPWDVISAWLETHLREYATIRKLVKIAIDYGSAPEGSTETDGALRSFYEREQAMLCETIERGVETGLFRAVDVSRTAQFISTYLDGVVVRSLVLKEFDPESAVAELNSFVHAYLTSGES